jgi:superfamily II RNA helicase
MAPPALADIQLEFYERFLIDRGLEPYPVQEQAMDRIFAGESVLVTVPTGTGKTLMAKAGLFKALKEGRRAIYTTPLRALTEEKFRELCDDFGAEHVGFATGDYKVRPEAPIQVLVAEILWNRIYGDRVKAPADIVIMDEGHYFNDPERGYVWEQSIIGLDPRAQLVILSATVGEAERFCQWVYLTRRVPLALIQSYDRKVPLYHEIREELLVDVCKGLFQQGDCPAIIFVFGREACFDKARLLKSCPRFTSDEERLRIAEQCDAALLDRGMAAELRPLLLHGIGVHHAGILPRYKQLVERLTLERLVKFVVSTETIAAGINLPAKRVIFPELRKFVGGKARLLTSAEYHQMAGRAGRPQFDTEGIAITLAPEAVVKAIREELREAKKGRFHVDEARVRKAAYARARSDAARASEVTWDPDIHARLVKGQPAPLRSQTRITAEQVLAIGLPDLTTAVLPGAAILAAEAEAKAAAEAAAARAAADPTGAAAAAAPGALAQALAAATASAATPAEA